MILDTHDPTRVLHRSGNPILEPDMWYENEGKPGIVYACGAVVKNGTLYVYYGGGDTVASVATTPLHSFVEDICKGYASLEEDSHAVTVPA
jgi:predicted GH43/DUF377 family glycosyl hydrolase